LKEKELHITMLLKQLEAHGDSGIQEIVSFETAKKELQAALKLLMSGEDVNGDAEKAFEKWDKFIQNHPEHIAEQERILEQWNADNEEANAEKLHLMRSYVPPDIWSTSQERLREAGLKADVARRIWTKKVIWFVRADPSRIARVHAADLNIAYSIQGLDIAELRAVWASLPATFENDGDKRKAAWRDKVRTKLKEMVSKEAQGSLSKVAKRAHCYGKEQTASPGPFDPLAPLVAVAPTVRGDAFSRTESGDDLNDLCKTGGSVSSRRSSLPDPSSLKKAAASVPTKKAGVRMKASDLLAEQTKAPGTPGRVKATDLMAELAGKLKIKGGTPKVGVAAGSPTAAASGGNALMAELRAKQSARQSTPTSPPPPYTLALFGAAAAKEREPNGQTPSLSSETNEPGTVGEEEEEEEEEEKEAKIISPPPPYNSIQKTGEPAALAEKKDAPGSPTAGIRIKAADLLATEKRLQPPGSPTAGVRIRAADLLATGKSLQPTAGIRIKASDLLATEEKEGAAAAAAGEKNSSTAGVRIKASDLLAASPVRRRAEVPPPEPTTDVAPIVAAAARPPAANEILAQMAQIRMSVAAKKSDGAVSQLR
jgi:hypothetical protein